MPSKLYWNGKPLDTAVADVRDSITSFLFPGPAEGGLAGATPLQPRLSWGKDLPRLDWIGARKRLKSMLPSDRTNKTANVADLSRAELAAMPYQAYLLTEYWKITRDKALSRADYKCQLCSSARYLQVHHNTYERLGAERDSDLIMLCRDCHARYHDKL